MENKSHALAAAAFVLALLVLLVAMIAWLAHDTREKRQFEIASQDAVSGLQVQAGVRYKGVAVGRVTAILLDPQSRGTVLVRISVNDSVPMTTATFASLGFQGVTGLAYVQLDDGPADKAGVVDLAAGARIPMRAGLMARLSEQGTSLLNELSQASARMDALLAASNQQKLMAAVSNLGDAAAALKQLTQHADQVLLGTGAAGTVSLPRMAAQVDASFKSMQGTAEKLGQSAEAVRASADEFRRASTRMTEAGGTLERVVRGADAVVNAAQTFNTSVAPRLNRATEETAHTVHQAGRLIESLDNNPQALLTGRSGVAPGPGEPGFVSPPSSGQ